MRRLLVALLVAAFLAPGFPAQAHATGAHHVTPKTVLLPPLSSNETVLEFEGGPLFEGWVFVLVARTRSVGVTVAAALRTGGAAVASWDLPADSDVRRFALIPQTATYTLQLSNPSPAETVAVDFYFDQSCSCLGKYLPYKPPEILFREALVLFNFDFGVGDKVDVIVPEPNALNLRVTLATRPGAGVEFPSDFNVLEVSNDATPYRATPSSPWFRIHRFQFTAAVAGTHYFFVEPTQYLAANYSDPIDLVVQPSVSVVPAETPGLPLVPLVLVAAALGVAGIVAWLRLAGRAKPAPQTAKGGRAGKKGLSKGGHRRGR